MGLGASRKIIMMITYCLAGVLALFVFGYLLYALLRAERF
jgi:K+-transporting ATPase KdpF subunit